MSLSSSTSSRPGPLCEWPLEHFIPSSSNSTQTKPCRNNRPNKRPLSLEGPNLFSPTKRRILTQEGIYSPEKTIKSTLRGKCNIGGSFSELLQAPCSPAKKLDYGRSPKPSSSETTPVRNQALSLRASAPKSTPRRDFVDDDFFATPERLPSFSYPQPSFTLIPRELPPATNPQSIHYPGFTVHRDPHITVMNPVSLDLSLQEDREDRNDWKENIVLKRKIKKDPLDPKLRLLTPKQELEKLFKAKLTPATPRKITSKEWQVVTSPTPRRTGLRSRPGTPVLSEEEKRQRRQMLKDEVEEVCLDEEEDM